MMLKKARIQGQKMVLDGQLQPKKDERDPEVSQTKSAMGERLAAK